MTEAECICRQVQAKLTSFGFPTSTRDMEVAEASRLSDTVKVVCLSGSAAPIYALVVEKRHSPVEAVHVVDFRVGNDIYSSVHPPAVAPEDMP